MNQLLLQDFIMLFRGRADCYGHWDGGCVREPLTAAVFEKHLNDGPHIGVYPTFNADGIAWCAWGCTDIDYDDFAEAARLADAFAAVDVAAWVEKTRKGYHIWVFAERAVPAENMRSMFLAAHQVADSKPKEVNPKQTVLGHGQIGNYVRLPYPAGAHTLRGLPHERYIVDRRAMNTPMGLEAFVGEATARKTSAERIAELATYYTPPAKAAVVVAEPTGDMTEATRLLTPLGRMMWRHGPIEGRDRSTTLAHLAFECSKAHLPPGDALMILEDADLRWGKYMMRGPKGQTELVKLLERAYGNTPSP